MTMNNKELEKKVKQFVSELSYLKGYVSSVDVLLKLGYITQSDYQNWRLGKIEYLEKVCDANLHKLSTVNKLIRKFAAEWNLEASWTGYNKFGKGPKKRLIFSKTRDSKIEYAYATHYLNKIRMIELKGEKQIKNSARTDTMTNKSGTDLLHDLDKIATTT
jgi:hypothetical protein